jgi:hypothetical protein
MEELMILAQNTAVSTSLSPFSSTIRTWGYLFKHIDLSSLDVFLGFKMPLGSLPRNRKRMIKQIKVMNSSYHRQLHANEIRTSFTSRFPSSKNFVGASKR